MATAFDTPVVPFTGPFAELPTQLLEASTRALNASAELYTEVLTSQAEATRAVLAAYAGLGTQAVQAGAETTEHAEQAATRATRRTGTAAKRATRRTASGTRRAAAKPQPRRAAVEAPIPGYDDLTADEVAAKLPEQPQTVLAQIASYEQANEKRATVLQRVAALTGPEPAPGYDEMTADEATKLVNDGSPALATTVRDYERRHKDRASVIEAATRNADGETS